MNILAIFFLTSLAFVTAQTSGTNCTIYSDCKTLYPTGVKHHCLPDLKICYTAPFAPLSPSEKPCHLDLDCTAGPEIGIRVYCDISSGTCFSRKVKTPGPNDLPCKTEEDCNRQLVGVA